MSEGGRNCDSATVPLIGPTPLTAHAGFGIFFIRVGDYELVRETTLWCVGLRAKVLFPK